MNISYEPCRIDPAKPLFVFGLEDESIQIMLWAKSESDDSEWEWTGFEWRSKITRKVESKIVVLDDDRLDNAVKWLNNLDCWSPKPGVWVECLTENFIKRLRLAFKKRPEGDYMWDKNFNNFFETL